MLGNKDILLDLFYQVTDYQCSDVAWSECLESLPFYDLDFAMLRVKMHTGEFITLTNQFGNIHVTVSHSDGTTENQYHPSSGEGA